MHIEQKPILEVLCDNSARYVIPVFQRVYSWNARQCEELWDDIIFAGKEGEPHFMGMLLFSRDPDGHGGREQISVIDGQQRMTTMMLLLSAMGPGEFNLAPLSLSSMDRETFDAIVAGEELPETPAARLADNYLVFARKMEDESFDAQALIDGLRWLTVATVMLEADDSPQLVFESLNSKGMALSTADRVRNLLVASTTDEVQEHLYNDVWLPLEHMAASGKAPMTTTDVLHAWLAQRYRSVRILDASDVYGIFKTCLRDEYGDSLERALIAATEFCEKLKTDEPFRAEALERAHDWVAGKPEGSVSEFKLFGD